MTSTTVTEQSPEALIALFDGLFKASLNTVLVRGDDEPIYLPADHEHPHHRVIFAHGFFASALHEISHWCIAGTERRKLVDFGYWYKPDGRTAEEQAEFEQVEIKPQALEWMLSQAAGHRFHFSADNLGSDIGASPAFKQNVQQQIFHYLEQGLPQRPKLLIDAFHQHFGTIPLTPDQFSLDDK